MAERSYPAEWTDLLPAETARWVDQGLITAEQQKGILGLYPAPGAGGRDRTILLFTILGSLLVGAGVILFFAANWPRIPATAKVGAIITAVAGVYGWGYQLHFRRSGDYPRLGQAVIFLGSLLYGAAIWLVAQIFHLETHFATGFLLWGLGALPVAWAVGSLPVLYLAVATLQVWTLGAQTATNSYNYAFPAVIIGGVLPLARRLGTALGEAGVLGGVFLWFLMNVLAHPGVTGDAGAFLAARVALVGGAVLLAGGMARMGDQRAWLGLGGLLALLGAYMMTFQMGPPSAPAPVALWAGSAFQVAGLGALALGAVAGAGAYVRSGEPASRWIAPLVLAPIAAAAAAHLPGEVQRIVLFNVLLFAGILGCITLGIRLRNGLLVNLGLGVFVVQVLTRYFDFFFSAMNRSLFFMLGGALLLGGGWLLERNRRRWMQGLGGDHRAG